MKIRLKTFASVADACGFRERTVTVADGSTPGTVLQELVDEYPKLSHLKDVVMAAVNEEHVDFTVILHDGDELALFPPVSGG